jgi:hypothetical protein
VVIVVESLLLLVPEISCAAAVVEELELDDEASYVRVEVTGGTFSTLSDSPQSCASLHAHQVCNALVFGLGLLGFAFLCRQGDADALIRNRDVHQRF